MSAPAAALLPTLGGYQVWADLWVRAGWRVQESVLTGSCRLLDPRDRRIVSGAADECLEQGRALAPPLAARRAAILIHGMGRTRRSMGRMERALAEAGWAVATLAYPSLLRPLAAHAAQVRRVADALLDAGAEEVSVVGHSLGGLVARAAMAEAWPRGRAVLIGCPNRGAALADRLARIGVFGMAGPCGPMLTTVGSAAIPIPARPFLVIAGGNGRRGFNPLLEGDNDGIVTVAETRLGAAEAGFAHVAAIHTVLPLRRDVIAATLAFLAAGPSPAAHRGHRA